ncbi:restriction endonuclease subunit S [Thauera chlorobenzoica]|uniref:restriction endonuclease subunit S n=1 Tax=Thauera chlorobenzoica TaxID=96773 RepID=UPI00089FEF07|nr:restriction endonuclease subunit S [Thauera chlorobenzoica]SEF84200.1 type I restriction enzyme, S subunit [Thauera chlorobenzoica]
MTWRELTLGDCVTLQSGGTPSKANAAYWSGPVAWVSAKDMTTLRLQDTEDHVSVEAIGNGTRLVQKGTLLAVVRGMSLAKEFRIVEVQRPMAFNQDVKAIIPRDGVDSRFILYSLLARREYVLGIADEAAHGTKRLQTDRFLAVPVSLPNLPMQRRIASILSAYDDLIENNTRRIAILEEMARRIFEEWFVRFRFPGHEQVKMVESELGLIPEGWKVQTVEQAFQILGGGTPSKAEPAYWEGGTINWYSPTDLTRAGTSFMEQSADRITALGLAKSSAKLFPPMSVMLTSRATIGVVAVNTNEACTNQGFITCLPNSDYPLWLLYHWLKANVETFIGLGTGATFKEITKGTFKGIRLLVPPQDLVGAFSSTAEQLMLLSLNLQRKNRNLRATRDLLLPKLISGELDVSKLPEPTV